MSRTINVRTMLYWVFLIALIMPYVVALLPRKYNPLVSFSVSESEIEGWLQEIDPSVSYSYSRGESNTDDSYSFNTRGLVICQSANSDPFVSHLRSRIKQKFESQMWLQDGGGYGNSSFHYHLQRFKSNCHIYCFASGPDREACKFLEQLGKEGFTLTIIVLCYSR